MTAAAIITPSNTGVDAAAVVRSGSPQATPKEAPSLRREWIRLLIATLARTLLILAVSMAGWSSLPALLGWTPTTVMSGSMEPSISTGDVVVTRPVDPSEYKPGRVALVDDPVTEDKLLLHRIVRQDDVGSLVLRGDANVSEDPSPVAPSAVHGVGIILVPYVGVPVYWVSTAQWFKLALLVGSLILLCWASTLDRALQQSRHRGDPPSRGAGTAGKVSRGATSRGLESLGLTDKAARTPVAFQAAQVDRIRPTGRRSARLGAAVVASALVLGTVPVAAQAAWVSTSQNTANTLTSAKYVTCGGAVLADQPSAFYQFDKDTGRTVVNAVTPGTNDAVFEGNQQYVSPPSTLACPNDGGKAATFDGTAATRITTFLNLQAPQTFTYEMWFRTPKDHAMGGKLMAFAINPAAGGTPVADTNVLYMLSNGRLRFGLENASGNQLTSAVTNGLPRYNDGVWHHAAATLRYDSSTAKTVMELYIDGQMTNSAPLAKANPSSTGSWIVGSGTSGTWTAESPKIPFTGNIDNVAVYQGKVLTAPQVKAHFDAGRAAKKQP